MVEHMVWIRFKDTVQSDRIKTHLDGLRGLKEKVPQVVELSLGENFTDRAQGYTHGLLVRLKSREDLESYAIHPEHVAVAEPLRADADLMAMDIEV